MPLFGGATKKGYLGVDIGAGGIKVVEIVNEKGRSRLVTYGYSEALKVEGAKGLIEDPRLAGDTLAKVVKQSGVEATRAVSALPLSKVFSAIIRVPMVKEEKELKPLIEAQARKLTPLPLEEMILDSKLIDEIKKPEKVKKAKKQKSKKSSEAPRPLVPEPKQREYVRILITGAAKSLVQKYVNVFKTAKLELAALETESFALIRSLVGKDRSTILIIDIGATRSNLTIVEKGVPFLTRSVQVGGDMVTKRIADTMGLGLGEAEQVKHDLARTGGAQIQIVEETLKPILNEIQYAFEQYARQEFKEAKQVEKIIITGGSAHLPNVTNFISEKTNLNTYLGDPWARVVYPEDLRPVLDEIGPRMAIAVGLAMRDNE